MFVDLYIIVQFSQKNCCPTTAHPTVFYVCKTGGCLCSFRLLMMGGVSPETC